MIEMIEKIIITEECSKTTQQESKSTLPSDQISALSTYKRNKIAMATPTQKPTEQKCSNCGSDSHKSYRELPEDKKAECKAHNKFCENCGRRHHLTALCRSLPPDQDIDRPEYYNGEHNCLQILPPEELQDEVQDAAVDMRMVLCSSMSVFSGMFGVLLTGSKSWVMLSTNRAQRRQLATSGVERARAAAG